MSDIFEMADSDKISRFMETELYKIFCLEILEYDPNDILITDESELRDFPEELEVYRERILKRFNVDITYIKPDRIYRILETIIDSRGIKYSLFF